MTYLHLGGAVLAFIGTRSVPAQHARHRRPGDARSCGTRFGWLVVLGAFIGVSYVANYWASSSTSVGMQYLGLGLYVVAEAVIFVPLLWIAQNVTAPGTNVIGIAGLLTVLVVQRADRDRVSHRRRLLVPAHRAHGGWPSWPWA